MKTTKARCVHVFTTKCVCSVIKSVNLIVKTFRFGTKIEATYGHFFCLSKYVQMFEFQGLVYLTIYSVYTGFSPIFRKLFDLLKMKLSGSRQLKFW